MARKCRGQRYRYNRLAVRAFAQHRGVLGRNADRRFTLFRQHGVVDDQPSVVTAEQLVCLVPQGCFKWSAHPQASADKMVEPIIADLIQTSRHGPDTLAIAWTNQACDVGRAHPASRLVPQHIQIRSKPPLQIRPPILVHNQPPSMLAPHASRNLRHGNPKTQIAAK